MGLFFSRFVVSFKPAIPLIVLFFYFIISEKYIASDKMFLISGLLLLVIFAVLSISDLFIDEFFAAFAFSIAISAYLASFESWRVTSHLATQKSGETSDNGDSLTKGIHTNYYFATLSAMVIASLITPFLYIFTKFGIIFLGGFFLHSIISFSFWYIRGSKIHTLRNQNWIIYKIIFGFLFLAIMVVDSYFKVEPGKSCMPELVTFSGLSIFIAIATVPATVFYHKNKHILMDENGKLPVLKRLFTDRRNFIRIIGPLSIVMCVLLLLIKDSQCATSLNDKINYAFFVYLFYIVISVCAMLIKYIISYNKESLKEERNPKN